LPLLIYALGALAFYIGVPIAGVIFLVAGALASAAEG
jgi:hypothetical protein